MKILLCALGVLLPLCIMTAVAAEVDLKRITVSNPYLMAFGKNAKAGSGYFVISNKNSSAVILNEVTSGIGAAMLHKTDIDEKGVAKMKHLENIVVPGNGSLKLEPGGTHIMFMNLQNKLEENERYPVTLFFKGLGSLKIDFILKSPKKNKKSHKHDNGHSHKHDH
tara:strand:- start:19 stop:516 length:498 start_codon:yes stop_codon:yes gene_type:complete